MFTNGKKDIPVNNDKFTGIFSDPPENMRLIWHFKTFFPDDLINKTVENTNLYSTQHDGKCVDTKAKEKKTFIEMNTLMGKVKLLQYYKYRRNTLWYITIADVTPQNWFSELRQNLHSMDNNSKHDQDVKLFKIWPIIKTVRNEYVKTEIEEFQSVDEQVILFKTKFTKIKQSKETKKIGI